MDTCRGDRIVIVLWGMREVRLLVYIQEDALGHDNIDRFWRPKQRVTHQLLPPSLNSSRV